MKYIFWFMVTILLETQCRVVDGRQFSTNCSYSYDTLSVSNEFVKVVDFNLYDDSNNLIFDWPNSIGPVLINVENENSIGVLCFINNIDTIISENVQYKQVPILKLILDSKGCLSNYDIIEDSFSINIMDTTILLNTYLAYKEQVKKLDLNYESNEILTILQFSFYLRDASLLGCEACREELMQINNTFEMLFTGTFAQDYFSNCHSVDKILSLSKK